MWEDNKHHKSPAINQKQLFHVMIQTCGLELQEAICYGVTDSYMHAELRRGQAFLRANAGQHDIKYLCYLLAGVILDKIFLLWLGWFPIS